MNKLSTAELRAAFLKYFQEQGHAVVPTSSLIPGNDPTLLFTNAGMVQFKDVFLGSDKRDYKRATSVQRCVRAGGKHNDLENVGFTARHHTFFEMLGNFSFGDYFKREAIRFAWEFLTKDLGLPKEKLWVTVYEKDDETAKIWLEEMGVDPDRFSRCGEKSNFWAMGDTGPCGPCTEIFYDHGAEIWGGPPGSPDEDGDRYIEIWNLVFMQFERFANGEMKPLPKPSVDTGMGLERIAAVLQNVHSNYEIDLFQALIKAAAHATGCQDLLHTSLKVIADHIRSCSFLIVDGVRPSNEGRGYVLRRIIRRAARHGYELGQKQPFFYHLVDALVMQMGEAYPELVTHQKVVKDVLLREEQQFAETLENGMKLLEKDIQALQGNIISGETVFKLYDTYGFPVDLTADIARKHGLTLDEAGFERCMQQQRERSQANSKFAVDYTKNANIQEKSEFTGYVTLQDQSKVMKILKGEEDVTQLNTGEEGALILDHTPFYAESGGQVGDVGVIVTEQAEFIVKDTQKVNQAIVHYGVVQKGLFQLKQAVKAIVDEEKRKAAARHHSATHLLHAALHLILGSQVEQKGSLVAPDRLRFDFNYEKPLSRTQLRIIENQVNQWITANVTVCPEEMDIDAARQSGAKALFGEKYADRVRVLSMGEISKELCGGTHVNRTGDIGFFKVISETGIASGVRRIEAAVGDYAVQHVGYLEDCLQQAQSLVNAKPEQLAQRIQQILDQQKAYEKQVQQLQQQIAAQLGQSLRQQFKNLGSIKLLTAHVNNLDAKGLRELSEQLRANEESAVVVLAGMNTDGKFPLVVSVSKDLSAKVNANEVFAKLTSIVGGKGGGRPDMAQGSGAEETSLPEAFKALEQAF